MEPINRNTMRADGLTVGEAIDTDAAFLRSIGIDPTDNKPRDEQREVFIQKTRATILAALDSLVPTGHGWEDGDLPELFKPLDKHAAKLFDRITDDMVRDFGWPLPK